MAATGGNTGNEVPSPVTQRYVIRRKLRLHSIESQSRPAHLNLLDLCRAAHQGALESVAIGTHRRRTVWWRHWCTDDSSVAVVGRRTRPCRKRALVSLTDRRTERRWWRGRPGGWLLNPRLERSGSEPAWLWMPAADWDRGIAWGTAGGIGIGKFRGIPLLGNPSGNPYISDNSQEWKHGYRCHIVEWDLKGSSDDAMLLRIGGYYTILHLHICALRTAVVNENRTLGGGPILPPPPPRMSWGIIPGEPPTSNTGKT